MNQSYLECDGLLCGGASLLVIQETIVDTETAEYRERLHAHTHTHTHTHTRHTMSHSVRMSPRHFYGRPTEYGDHYIFFLWSLFSIFFYLFFLLAYSQPSPIGCLPYFDTWCGLSANLECRSETCCTRLAGNKGRKKSPKIRHLRTIAQPWRAISSQLTIGKKLLNSNISSTCPHNMANLRLRSVR